MSWWGWIALTLAVLLMVFVGGVGFIIYAWVRKWSGQMPFASEAQRRFMHMAHPKIAHAWEHGRSSVTGKKEAPSKQGKPKRRRK